MQLDHNHKQHLVPPKEIKERISRLQTAMTQMELGAIWIDNIPGLYYYTGSIQDSTLLVPASGVPTFLVRKSLERARLESPLDAQKHPGRRAAFAAFGEMGKKLGIAYDSVTVSDFKRIESTVKDSKIGDVSSLLRGQRIIKSKWEIEQINLATRVGEAGFNEIPNVIKPGISEIDLSIAIEAKMRKAGHQGLVRCVDPHFEIPGPLISSGAGALYPTNNNGSLGSTGLFPASPGGSGRQLIKEGETVMADIASTFNGYNSDNSRVFTVGNKAPDAATNAHNFCLECLRQIEQRMKPGAICEQIYEEVDAWAEKEGKPEGFLGFGENQMAFLGHGIGIELDETPVIARRIKNELKTGLVIAIEPKAYLPGIGPVGIENTYEITETGCRSLCNYPEEITPCK